LPRANSAILARIPGDTLDTTAPVSGPPRAFHGNRLHGRTRKLSGHYIL